jgi:hypothetical protein
LEYGNGRVDTTTLLEESSDGTTRALWSDKDDIDISWDINLGLILENWRETMGKIKSLNQSAKSTIT